MKINVGDYVRSKINGRMGRVTDIEIIKYDDPFNPFGRYGIRYILDNNPNTGFCETEIDSVKSSPNIIDLVEVGDYVNRYYVDRTKYHYMGEDFIDFEKDVDAGSGYGHQLLAKDIKSIITREQIEQMSYKVGE